MPFPKYLAILVWIAILATIGCAGGAHVEKIDSPDDDSPTPESNVDFSLVAPHEAEMLALCVSETLFPLSKLVEQFRYDLAAIRTAYGFSPVHSTHPRAGWTHAIEIQFDGTAAHEFTMGGYFQWNELNAELGPVGIVPLESERVALEFAATINPCTAAKLYEELPGILSATPLFDATDGPEIFIGFSVWHGYTYLFRYAYGDCEYRCRNEEYYYFRFNDIGPILVGRWDPALAGAPAWWHEAEDERIECSCQPPTPQIPKKSRRE
jgi:hypothetical protein